MSWPINGDYWVGTIFITNIWKKKKKKMLEKSWFPEMHHIWKKYFPDVVPKQFGIGGFFTLVDKKGDAHTIFTGDVKNPMGRILWNDNSS